MTFSAAGEDVARVSLYFSDTQDFLWGFPLFFGHPRGRSVEQRGERGTQRDQKKSIFFTARDVCVVN